MNLLAIGEITLDHYPDFQQAFVGGISLNFAVQAKRCGAEQVSLISRVGQDEAGRQVLAALHREGVEAGWVTAVPGQTATIAVQITADGERIFPPGTFHRHVLEQFQLTPAELALCPQHDLIATLYDHSQPGLFFPQLVAEPALAGKLVVDFGDWADYGGEYSAVFQHMPACHIAFISGTAVTVAALQPLSQTIDSLIVVTLGAAGSVALRNGRSYSQPALPVPHIVDPTGCGDAFQAAFTVAYQRTGSIPHALQQGAAQAAHTLQHLSSLNLPAAFI
ncbi:MAG: hypothetical protein H6658_04815 [Ardenticatenaceae bacterium]|nr:hypothetical protein [Ardenticatenaceae bacterium]